MLRNNGVEVVLGSILLMLDLCSGLMNRSLTYELHFPTEMDISTEKSDSAEGESFLDPDNAEFDKFFAWRRNEILTPEAQGQFVEGDMLITESMRRNGIKSDWARWPGGVVPYVISPIFNEKQLDLIQEAMDDYKRNTCVRFVPYIGQGPDYLVIDGEKKGCFSVVGRNGGPQDVNLNTKGCLVSKRTVLHELMHSIGFFHEQTRHDRDEYVDIVWDNIKPGLEENFRKRDKERTDFFGDGYDYKSVMHYPATAFTSNGEYTILPKFTDPKNLGSKSEFSQGDIKKIRAMYKCDKTDGGDDDDRDGDDYEYNDRDDDDDDDDDDNDVDVDKGDDYNYIDGKGNGDSNGDGDDYDDLNNFFNQLFNFYLQDKQTPYHPTFPGFNKQNRNQII